MSDNNLKFNILSNEIIRIDFMKVDNLDEKISKIISLLKGKGYELNESTEYDDNIEKLRDPNSLITQDIMEKSRKNIINYTFEKGSEKIIINEYLLIFEKYEFQDYVTIDKYLQNINSILKILMEKVEYLNFKRVGIRKVNRVIMKKEYDISYIFNQIDNTQIDDNDEQNVMIENKKRVTSKDISYNVGFYVNNGVAKIQHPNQDPEECKAYMINLDLDYYCRNLDGLDSDDILKKLEMLNNKLYEKFKESINKDFFDKLKNEDDEKNFLNNYGIIGGINRCKN